MAAKGTPTDREIRARIKQLREAASLTQLETAHRAHVDQTTISLFENGYINLRPEQIAALEQVCRKELAKRLGELNRLGVEAGISA